MPPAIKRTRRDMSNAAAEIIDESGEDALTARKLAERLGISTQPIYREFGDMAEIKASAAKSGYEFFAQYMNGEALDQAVRYVRFATEHKKLFRFLFGAQNIKYDGLDDMAHRLVEGTGIIERLVGITGLSEEATYRLHLFEWLALHGLASLSVDNEVSVTDEEIREFTTELTHALTAYYKSP